jgi:hypothetical protein
MGVLVGAPPASASLTQQRVSVSTMERTEFFELKPSAKGSELLLLV